MIAQSEVLNECEQIAALLRRYADHPLAAPVLRDIQDVQRLLDIYSFRAPQAAERFCSAVSNRYHDEIAALYASPGSPSRQTDSAYLRLQQLLGALVRVAVTRLCREGSLTISPSMIAGSDGLLLLALRYAVSD